MEKYNNSLAKMIQFKFYSLLSSRIGMIVMILGILITLNILFQFFTLLGIRDGLSNNNNNISGDTEEYEKIDFSDNIIGKDLEQLLCSQPIDVVYTWVNGSDPNLIRQVTELKRKLRDPNMPECKEKQSPNKDNCFRDDNPTNRYVDNQELKYSLRSLEKFAPWIRHIYIVTNGQVPNWIDLSNPKLSIITHKQIYENQSHLPSFSSPSIESHIHKIPGLSKKFLYLNDDVMFGRPIYPDDFYTQQGGQKVFLSWPVPNCNDGCPNNWIGDGFCDLACNVSTCDFDGNDCNNSTGQVKTRWWSRGNSFQPGGATTNTNGGGAGGGGGAGVFNNDKQKIYCSRGCPETWVGDKHCDRMCKNIECGFDAGDCGVDIMFKEMVGYNITTDTTVIDIPDLTQSVYFNLTSLIQNSTITDGSHDNSDIVRTATISQKYKIMTLVFRQNITRQNVSISVSYEGTDKKPIEKSFNITISTEIKQSPSPTTNDTLSSSSPTNNSNNTNNNINNSNNNSQSSSSNNVENESSSLSIVNNENIQFSNSNSEITMENDEKQVVTQSEETTKVISSSEQNNNIPSEILTDRDNVVNDGGALVEDTLNKQQDTGGFQSRGVKSIEFDLVEIEIEEDENDKYEDDSDDYVQNQLKYLQRKQKELDQYNQMVEESEFEMKYRINRETEQELKEEGGQIYPWETEVIDDNDNSQMSRMQRKPLDVFGDSLKFVNRLYSVEFGSQTRKVPAHMPHMIDVDIMNEMQLKWPKQWGDTSSHQLRSPRDMQYAFSFFYYMIHKKVPFDIDQLWHKELDVNRDGQMDFNELRTFAVVVYGVPLKSTIWKDLKSALYQTCMEKRVADLAQGTLMEDQEQQDRLTKVNYAETKESKRLHCPITLEVLKASNKTMEDAKKAFSKRNYYKTSMEGTDEVAFIMISNNDTVAESKLDGIRQRKHKFICLNDNMDHSNETDTSSIRVVHDFYESLFPFPSSFELPTGQQNAFAYIEDFIEVKKEIVQRNHTSFYTIVLLCAIVLVFLWKFKVSTSFNNSSYSSKHRKFKNRSITSQKKSNSLIV
ncbi:putative glycophosphotransferase [Tieghemostelium lacteum]|uniref:Putative glycophosphotransferase n=1 Tax=Tieghemostelium lacteum TaxID=361077 RepID=A0A151Z4D6_TIELA|nr:putative glycophosphotransferase [Tieghemostelium lacteum]|eukprot:KYQ88805.1 putative glycophosphotransferase [Tieghemostelium lacteum]